MGAGLRPIAKAVDTPPDPTVGAPPADSTNSKNDRNFELKTSTRGVFCQSLTEQLPFVFDPHPEILH